jgi:hypothetical protein
MLGTLIHDALAIVGVTPEWVETKIGVKCRCKERQEKLDALTAWARMVLGGKLSDAKNYLSKIL